MKVLVLANYGMGLYNFRKELLERLIEDDNEVYISLPNDEYVSKLKEIGCKFIDTQLDRRGTNPIADMKLLLNYRKLIKQNNPDIVLTYTIKPNVYGGIACATTKTPYLTNITGLGTSIENKGLMQKVTLFLYKLGLKKTSCVFFQNEDNQTFFINNKITKSKTKLLPGSGVNLVEHQFEEYPPEDGNVRFLFIGRVMKAKGIEELLEAAEVIHKKHNNIQFDIVGGLEEDYIQRLQELEGQGIIKYHGQQRDIHSFIKQSHATILPSYHEGLANVLLESAACGRPILASNVPGCIETFDEAVTGFGFEVRNVESLIATIEKFLKLTHSQKVKMGYEGRKKMEKVFDREIVIDTYVNEISKITATDEENFK